MSGPPGRKEEPEPPPAAPRADGEDAWWEQPWAPDRAWRPPADASWWSTRARRQTERHQQRAWRRAERHWNKWRSSPRPPWWPANEPWPPDRPGTWPRGPFSAAPHHAGGPAWHRPYVGFGCLFGLFFLIAIAVVVVLASIALGLVTLVLGGGRPGFLETAALIVLVVGIIAIVGSGRVVRHTGHVLDELVEAAGRVEVGDYTARVEAPRRAPPALNDLVDGFNTMAAHLEADERQRRSLLADVSHELRTPLAVVQGNLEGLVDGVYPADEAHLSAILEETRVLSRLVDDLRTLALSESGTLTLHREPTDVGVLASEVIASFRPGASAAGVTLSAAIDEAIPLLEVDPLRTREVLFNLVANALRYTPSGGSVRVTGGLEQVGARQWARVAVLDTGAGMEPEVLRHAFDRLWRSADSRGSGLGLAIAKNLVEAHGGQIGAESVPGTGTTIWFRLPI